MVIMKKNEWKASKEFAKSKTRILDLKLDFEEMERIQAEWEKIWEKCSYRREPRVVSIPPVYSKCRHPKNHFKVCEPFSCPRARRL